MPNSLTATGITTATQPELVTNLTAQYQVIYGADIDLDSDTPDGQTINNFAQVAADEGDLLTQIYNMFDPDNAIGVVLDQRVAINGIQRLGGTFTVTNITLVTSGALTLYGLDQTAQPVYTVADNANNQWQLQSTQIVNAAGTYIFSFQAANVGAVITIPNTINVPVTIVLGVVSVNNPAIYTTLGTNQETDAALKIRRQKSVSLPSQGYLAGLLAALENTPGVTFAFIEENTTSTTNGDGVPGHSIWVIVAGTATAASIANAIYVKRNAGCGMFGSVTFTITQVDGSPFIIRWDTVIPEPLFIKFTATSLNGTTPPNIAGIVAGLPTIFVPGVFGEVNINELATFVQQIDPNTLVTNAGFSISSVGSYTNTLVPAAKTNQFAISTPNIIVLPMLLLPATDIVTHGTTAQFNGYGGFGSLTYSVLVNNSGGSISGSGLYTAGATHPVTDTIKVQDTLGNIATATISVI